MNETELTVRQQQIVEWLRAEQSLTIGDLARRLGVSSMTVHRDHNDLAQQGLLRKVRGGAVLAVARHGPQANSPATCVMCGKPVPARTAWVATQATGERWQSCCAHCGLLALLSSGQALSVLATDFIYGRMVNAFQATYVIGSEITLCCAPSTLCFAARADAERYSAAFGGDVFDFEAATSAMARMHGRH